MSKQILPRELAEIVTKLLTTNTLDAKEQFMQFFEEIGQVVADHCGGEINGVSEPDFPGSDGEGGQYMLSVSANENIAFIDDNVWTPYDQDGLL